MNTNRNAIYNEMLNFYVLTGNDGQRELGNIHSIMNGFLTQAREAIEQEKDDEAKIRKLIDLVYVDWGFLTDSNNSFDHSNYYLPDVLTNRRGVAISVGGVLLYLAEKLELPIYAMEFPVNIMLKADVNGKHLYFDPWTGRESSEKYIEYIFRVHYGDEVEFSVPLLGELDEEELEFRYGQLAKNSLMRENNFEPALAYIENVLERYPGSLDEIRDRGILKMQLGRLQEALKDLEEFVEKRPDDSFSIMFKEQLPLIKKDIEAQEKAKKESIH